MGKEHAQSHFVSPRVRRSRELGDNRSNWNVEIKNSSLVKDHCHGGGGNDFGDGSDVEQILISNRRRRRVVGEAAERFEGYKLSAVCDSE